MIYVVDIIHLGGLIDSNDLDFLLKLHPAKQKQVNFILGLDSMSANAKIHT